MAIFHWNGEDWLVSKRWPEGGVRAPILDVVDQLIDRILRDLDEGRGDQLTARPLWNSALPFLGARPGVTPPPDDISFRSATPPRTIFVDVNGVEQSYTPKQTDDLDDLIRWLEGIFLSQTFFSPGVFAEDFIADFDAEFSKSVENTFNGGEIIIDLFERQAQRTQRIPRSHPVDFNFHQIVARNLFPRRRARTQSRRRTRR